jgi:D-alanyl-D-alanine carboxypeptidase
VKRLVPLVLAAVVLTAAAAAVVLQTRDDGAEPRPELQRMIDRLVAGDDRVAPGVTAVAIGPRGTWAGAAGVLDVRTGEPMPVDARMRLESVSKLWTATVLLRLVEQGWLGLDDTVAELYPGLLPQGHRLTLRQLLNHTSGLVDDNDLAASSRYYLDQVTDKQLRAELLRAGARLETDPEYEVPARLVIRWAAALPLRSRPGESYHYSNIGYQIAGLIAEQAAQRSFAELVGSEIVLPLELESAAYDPRSRITGPHARGYALAADGTLVDTTRRVEDLAANGGVVAHALDEARFLTALMRGELLRPASLAALKTPSAAAAYGLGTAIEQTACGTAYTHNGGGSGFTTSAYVSGDGTRAAVVLLNARTPDGRGDELAKDTAAELFCAA